MVQMNSSTNHPFKAWLTVDNARDEGLICLWKYDQPPEYRGNPDGWNHKSVDHDMERNSLLVENVESVDAVQKYYEILYPAPVTIDESVMQCIEVVVRERECTEDKQTAAEVCWKGLENQCDAMRDELNRFKEEVADGMMDHPVFQAGDNSLCKGNFPPTRNANAQANLSLVYRHLEDARMRLGKVMQAIQGGESILDRDK